MIAAPEDMFALEGVLLGPTMPVVMHQERIDEFARATEDVQWIHVDPDRAQRGPFGATVAHGYLTLSLVARGLTELLPLGDDVVSINYGLDRVRFPAPVILGALLEMTALIHDVRAVGGGVEFRALCTIASEGAAKPACVAEAVLRYWRP